MFKPFKSFNRFAPFKTLTRIRNRPRRSISNIRKHLDTCKAWNGALEPTAPFRPKLFERFERVQTVTGRACALPCFFSAAWAASVTVNSASDSLSVSSTGVKAKSV
jgi:hypothetical protein